LRGQSMRDVRHLVMLTALISDDALHAAGQLVSQVLRGRRVDNPIADYRCCVRLVAKRKGRWRRGEYDGNNRLAWQGCNSLEITFKDVRRPQVRRHPLMGCAGGGGGSQVLPSDRW